MLINRARFRALCRVRDRLLSGEASIRELASEVRLSPFHFIRVFEAVFGVTPHQLRIRARLDRAKDLLSRGSMSVTDVCFEVGSASVGTFSDLFQRHVGVAPSSYRRREQPKPPIDGCYGLMTMLPPDAFAISEKRTKEPSSTLHTQ